MAPLDPSNPATSARPNRAPADPRPVPAAPESHGEVPAGLPPILDAVPTPPALFQALRRRWLLALFLALLGGGATVALICRLVPAHHVTEVRVQFRRPPDYMPGGSDGQTLDDYIRSQALVLRSGRLLADTLRRPEVRGLGMVQANESDPSWPASDLVIKPAAGENILPIKLSGDDTREVAVFLNALLETHRAGLREERLTQLRRLRAIVEIDDKELEALNRQLPSIDPGQVEAISSDLTRTRIDLRRAEAELDARARVALAPVDPNVLADAVDDAARGNAEIQQLLGNLAVEERKKNDIARFSADGVNDRRIIPLNREIDRLEGEMRAARDRLSEKLKRQIADRQKRAHELEVKLLGDKVALLKVEQQVLEAQLAQLQPALNPQLKALDARRRVLEAIREQALRNIKRIERDAKMMAIPAEDPLDLTARPAAAPEIGADIPWVIQLGNPTTSPSKDRSTQLRAAVAGGLGVVGLLLFGVAFAEFRGRRVASSDDVTLGLGIPTVGTLPILPARARRAALNNPGPRDLRFEGRLAEAVDAVRTFLLRALGEGPHVVLVTSAVPGEGKTSLAGQLAASLARAWRKTLLIDGDLRKPAAHLLFDVPPGPGFSEVLRGEAEPADTIRPTPVSRLSVMPAGLWDAHAQQALAQDSVFHLFEQLKEEYDVIVVDSCPVLPVTDTLLLGQHVDTVLLSVLKGTSRLPTVYAARQRLAALDIPVLGAVFVGNGGALGGLDIQYPRPAAG